jgi:hypothetical protein
VNGLSEETFGNRGRYSAGYPGFSAINGTNRFCEKSMNVLLFEVTDGAVAESVDDFGRRRTLAQ